MAKTDRFRPASWLHGTAQLSSVDLHAVAGDDLRRLPVVLRLLLENVVRNSAGTEREASVAALLAWLTGATSDAEIPFQPGRVLMHDTTSTPALVDIAAMRDALAEAGVDPSVLNPVVPVDVSVDHSLAVEAFAVDDAVSINQLIELRRNKERYSFLRWASQVLDGVRIHPPGTGIMHTINLEQLATVVRTEQRDGQLWAVPDTLLGTDSHTPMVNSIGVLGWGVGGLEAQTVMFGMPTMLRIPEVVGVRLVGTLPGGSSSTDLALVVTQRLRQLEVAGDFVEFHGPGVSTLSAGDRAVVANMAPEYGATTGFFAVDGRTLEYLRETGRSQADVDLVEAYCTRSGLWFDPLATPIFSRSIEIDLSRIGMQVAGPSRPQDLLAYWETGQALGASEPSPVDAAGTMPAFPVAIAAITSCTNTSDPRLLVAAGLVARKARERGLRAPPWVKTSLAPGSPAAASYLARAGLLADLEAVGFGIVGYGCTTCIGNPGPLTSQIEQASHDGRTRPVAILSGNRNFPGRVHPELGLGFIMAPALVVAFALAGDASRNLRDQAIQLDAQGRPVFLHDLLPREDEIEQHLRLGADADDYRRDFAVASANPGWHGLQAPVSPRFPWSARSTQLRRPPFAAADQPGMLGSFRAFPLLVLGDDVTTDHISPASAIPADSLVADYLVEQGEDRKDLNVFASRRGNWEVMLRGTFHNRNLVNRLAPGAPVAHTLHAPSGAIVPIVEAARRYQEAGQSVVIVGGARYGMGSSRDWAAKGVRLLGVRAVLAIGFERIHRSNLIGMGVLPVVLPADAHPDVLALAPGDMIEVDAQPQALRPRVAVPVRIVRANGEVLSLSGRAAVETQLEVQLLREGGVIPSILKRTIAAHPSAARQSAG